MIRLKQIFKLLGLFLCLVITGCLKDRSPPCKEVRLYLQAEPLFLDPRKGGERRSALVLRQLFEGLTRIGKDGLPELALAESVSQSGLEYCFTIRSARWSNGQEVKAEDFARAWKTVLNPEFGSLYSFVFFFIKNAKKAYLKECSLDEVGIEAIDDHTLKVTLEQATPYFLEILAHPVFSPVCQADPQNIFNGPFVLKEHAMNERIVLEKNPNYWNTDSATSDRLIFSIVEDPQTAYNLFEAGELDWYGDPCGYIPMEIVDQLKESKKLRSKSVDVNSWMYCRVDNPKLASPKIRKAIASAINREQICDTLLGNGERPSTTICSQFKSGNPHFVDNDPKAFALFKEGMSDLSMKEPPVITLTFWHDPNWICVAQALQQQLQTALGIQVELEGCDRATFFRRITGGQYELILCYWFNWYDDPYFVLDHLLSTDNAYNGSGWEDPEYQRLMQLALNDPDKREEYFRQMERLVMSHLPIIPLHYQTCKYAKAPNLDGEVFTSVGHVEFKWLEKQDR